MTPAQLLDAAQQLMLRCPDAALVRNPDRNLSIALGGWYIGWVDLRNGEVHLFSEEETGPSSS